MKNYFFLKKKKKDIKELLKWTESTKVQLIGTPKPLKCNNQGIV